MEIDAVIAPRGGAVELPRLEPWIGADDAFRVPRTPLIEHGEPLDLLGGQAPIAHRAHVEQQIAALACHLAESMNELASGLESRIGRIVAPALVDGEAGLPCARRRFRRNELLGRIEIAEARQAVVHQDVGLEGADERMELRAPPLLRR